MYVRVYEYVCLWEGAYVCMYRCMCIMQCTLQHTMQHTLQHTTSPPAIRYTCMNMYVCGRVRMYVRVNESVCLWEGAYVYVCIYVCTRVWMCVCMSVCFHTGRDTDYMYDCVRVCACMYACLSAYIYACTGYQQRYSTHISTYECM